MKNKILCILLLLAFVVLAGFIGEDPFLKVSKKDVEFRIPRGFPKPVYDFSQNKTSPEIFILGRKLFYDPILSSDNTVSCASCHQRIFAFAHMDHRLSHGINAQIGTRNVPSLQNLVWKDDFMWDGGVNHLEIQPITPITSPIEMNESLVHVVAKLKASPAYVNLFKKAYKDTLINSERILKSLAQFTGLMISANSRYDKYIAGKDTFSIAEKNGLKLFREKCASCHKEPLFTDNSFRNNGLTQDFDLKDNGREKITGQSKDKNTFKVPTLRNIERTNPYMHDGRFRNLNAVLAHYSCGSPCFDEGVDEKVQKIGNLTAKERLELVLFLKTLTDLEFLQDKRFADPGMN